jgi:hypothetical protein
MIAWAALAWEAYSMTFWVAAWELVATHRHSAHHAMRESVAMIQEQPKLAMATWIATRPAQQNQAHNMDTAQAQVSAYTRT